MSFLKQFLLFRDGWNEQAEKELEDTLVECAGSPTWRHRFLPAFTELLKREQFIKIMECLDRDKDIEFNRGFIAGIEMISNRLERIALKAGRDNH